MRRHCSCMWDKYLSAYNGLLRCQALGVAWEHGALPNVVEVQKQHDNALHTNATTSMGIGPIFERIHVRLYAFDVYTHGGCLILKHLGVMDTLCARRDFFSAQEEIIGIGPPRILWIGHRVERAHVLGELVDDVEFFAVRLAYNHSQQFFILC